MNTNKNQSPRPAFDNSSYLRPETTPKQRCVKLKCFVAENRTINESWIHDMNKIVAVYPATFQRGSPFLPSIETYTKKQIKRFSQQHPRWQTPKTSHTQEEQSKYYSTQDKSFNHQENDELQTKLSQALDKIKELTENQQSNQELTQKLQEAESKIKELSENLDINQSLKLTQEAVNCKMQKQIDELLKNQKSLDNSKFNLAKQKIQEFMHKNHRLKLEISKSRTSSKELNEHALQPELVDWDIQIMCDRVIQVLQCGSDSIEQLQQKNQDLQLKLDIKKLEKKKLKEEIKELKKQNQILQSSQTVNVNMTSKKINQDSQHTSHDKLQQVETNSKLADDKQMINQILSTLGHQALVDELLSKLQQDTLTEKIASQISQQDLIAKVATDNVAAINQIISVIDQQALTNLIAQSIDVNSLLKDQIDSTNLIDLIVPILDQQELMDKLFSNIGQQALVEKIVATISDSKDIKKLHSVSSKKSTELVSTRPARDAHKTGENKTRIIVSRRIFSSGSENGGVM